MGKFYITTPIYYPSATLHIGNAYTTVAADAIARFRRLEGDDVFFLTGTDEHGQKLAKTAARHGKAPLEYIEPIVVWIKDLWARLDISYDDFIRTTEPRHKAAVQKIVERLLASGDIYLGEYEGYYCVECEAYWTEFQAKRDDGYFCPDCGRPISRVKEKSYFFRLSKYADRLEEHIERHPEFILPESRKHEMLNNFIRPGLEDLSISRTNFDWGIPLPHDPEHVLYVWVDALSNYITALGYGSDDPSKFERYWPADVHLVGKDILRFHTIIWPAILMALGLPLPKTVFGHGWLLMPDGKMSKSKGNAIDPKFLIDRYGSDAVRYFLLREVPFGQDGVFTPEAFIRRTNSDLANDLGNLVHRTAAMIERYFDGRLPAPGEEAPADEAFRAEALGLRAKVKAAMDRFHLNVALGEIFAFVHRANQYIDETAPWALAKDPAARSRLGTVLYQLAEGIRILAVLLGPFMPRTPERIFAMFSVGPDDPARDYGRLETWGVLTPGRRVEKGPPLFPRLDLAAEIAAIDAHTAAARAQAEANLRSRSAGRANGPAGEGSAPAGAGPAKNTANRIPSEGGENRVAESPPKAPEGVTPIDLETFGKVELRAAEVVAAERVPGADRLLRLILDLGDERRQVVSGIAEHYAPEALVGKKLICVTNLKPARFRGVDSYGMILAASYDGALRVIEVPAEVPNGTRIR
ncbi:methionine--tRNA ligase [Hydrogenibacillus schlegelii]|uniref:Methionine--tRNA ligase n=1 Tax=Hydrogenibacillus schlegelii TaxID=1484 RepID=A0A132N2W4_HYDSH|nr:methionine--tRNA ligase [Hydrogenibacillus schlegelii]KWX03932.1 methionyl-tRNA synthetase [Hydrogenibacillus schlegelii]OAR04123.1 methionine--tRNA ligase [Hydrogenibacillus schlegelii]